MSKIPKTLKLLHKKLSKISSIEDNRVCKTYSKIRLHNGNLYTVPSISIDPDTEFYDLGDYIWDLGFRKFNDNYPPYESYIKYDTGEVLIVRCMPTTIDPAILYPDYDPEEDDEDQFAFEQDEQFTKTVLIIVPARISTLISIHVFEQ